MISAKSKIALAVTLGCFSSQQAFAREVTLSEAFRLSAVNNPKLKSIESGVSSATRQVEIEQSNYYPTLEAGVIAGTGLPGANSLLQVDGDMSAKNRVGEGGAVVLRENLWDFGRTSRRIEVARVERELKSSEQALTLAETYQSVFRTYAECSKLIGQLEVWNFVAQESSLIKREIDKMVKSGQRTLIESYLTDAQLKEAETSIAENNQKKKILETRLSILINSPKDSLSCLRLTEHDPAILKLLQQSPKSPYIERGEIQMKAAETKLHAQEAEFNPRLIALANGGYFRGEGLKTPWNYSVGIGLMLPLFDGFKTENEVARAQLLSDQQKWDVISEHQKIDLINNHLQEIIDSDKERLKFLNEEIASANTAFTLAKNRYLNFQGKMVDLRDALRNLTRIRLSVNDTEIEYLEALGSQKLFAGAQP